MTFAVRADACSVAFELHRPGAKLRSDHFKARSRAKTSRVRRSPSHLHVGTEPAACDGGMASLRGGHDASNNRRACSGLAALEKPGRRPAVVSAASVNCGTKSNSPPICTKLRFIFPASSSKTRYLSIFSSSLAAACSESLGLIPQRQEAVPDARNDCAIDPHAGFADPLEQCDHRRVGKIPLKSNIWALSGR